ncbi:MAG: SPOR domain-containing protein [Sphingobacteriaceae bacterium]|nr:SPOR domain-containing protein [Sphingobacteriaceae bacterium]
MNIQRQIITGIEELLHKHDFLVIPGFGGFVLKKSDAHFSANSSLLYPPSLAIGFNVQLKQDDGLLLLWLKEKLNCTAQDARIHLNEFAAYCSSILKTKGRLNIDNIGFFYTDFEGNIQFEADTNTNFLKSQFGLSALSVKELSPIEQNIIIETEDRIIATQKTATNPVKKYRQIAWAAVILALLFSGLLVFVSNTKISGKLKAAIGGDNQKSTYDLIQYPELILNEMHVEKTNYTSDVNGIAYIELEEHKVIAVKTFEVTELVHPKTTEESTINKRGDFEVVLGCFGVKSNAQKLIKQLKSKGIKAFMSGKNERNLYVVSAGGYNTKLNALDKLNSIKDLCPKAWIRKTN